MAVEKLEIETYFGKCKCCLKFGYLRPMWEEHEDEKEAYGKMLTQCFSIPWTIESSEEEDQICEDCIWKLQEANKFKQQILQNQIREQKIEVENEEIKIEVEESYDVEYLDEELLHKNTEETDTNEQNGEFDADYLEDIEMLDDDIENDDDESYKFDEDEQDDEDDKDSKGTISVPRKRTPRTEDAGSGSDTPKPKWPKKLPLQERWKTYRQYTDENIMLAVDEVILKTMTQRQAALKYNVPAKTLSAKIKAIRRKKPEPDNGIETTLKEHVVLLTKHRENLFSVLAYSNATPIGSNCGFACCFCPKQYRDAAELKNHTRTEHKPEKYQIKQVRSHCVKLDITELICTICYKEIEDLETLMKHLKFKHEKIMHYDIKNHLIPFKFDDSELKCVKCGRIFEFFKHLSEHMNDVHFRNYECDKCTRGFVNKSTLATHALQHNTGYFPCELCAKVYASKIRRYEHVRVAHKLKNKGRKCFFCDERFIDSPRKLKHEIEQHGVPQKLYDCKSCDKSFPVKRNLQRHIQTIHLLHRPFKCDIDGCDKGFFTNSQLATHILTHKDEKPFICDQCPKTYKSKTALVIHKYTHDDNREFQCRICKKRFTVEDNLETHLANVHNVLANSNL